MEKIDVGHHWDLQGLTGPGLKASAAHFYPCLLSPPPGLLRQVRKQFFFLKHLTQRLELCKMCF